MHKSVSTRVVPSTKYGADRAARKAEKLRAAVATFNNKPDDSGVSIPVACAILERSAASIWRDIAASRLESFTIGGSRRINVGSIRRACTANRTEALSPASTCR